MPRTRNEEIDEKILLLTIEEGAKKPANRFSTKDIALRLGISEFVIFDHFESKENLIAQADAYISIPFYQTVLASAKTSQHFSEFFSKMVDYLLAHPSHNAFAINYCRVFPRYEKDSNFPDYQKDTQILLESLCEIYPLKHPEDAFTIWARFNRELLSYCQLLIEKRIPDTPENRLTMSNLLFHGFSQYAN